MTAQIKRWAPVLAALGVGGAVTFALYKMFPPPAFAGYECPYCHKRFMEYTEYIEHIKTCKPTFLLTITAQVDTKDVSVPVKVYDDVTGAVVAEGNTPLETRLPTGSYVLEYPDRVTIEGVDYDIIGVEQK
jgi:hypothetical protein